MVNHDIYISGKELSTIEGVRNFIAYIEKFSMSHYATLSDSYKRYIEDAVGRLLLSAI